MILEQHNSPVSAVLAAQAMEGQGDRKKNQSPTVFALLPFAANQCSRVNPMFFGVSHLVMPVTDLERAARLWRDVIGFAIRRGDGYLDIDYGNVAIRLMQARHRVKLSPPLGPQCTGRLSGTTGGRHRFTL
jgi:hypothetical protein